MGWFGFLDFFPSCVRVLVRARGQGHSLKLSLGSSLPPPSEFETL